MEVMAAIRARRSVRQFGEKPVTKAVLEQVVDAARLAATARNEQPWAFVAVTDAARIVELAGMTDHGKFLAGAKACVAVFCADTKYYLEDGCAATQNLLVASAGLGLGSCWIAGDKKPYAAQIGEALSVPPGYKLVSLVALGYPLSLSAAPEKKGLKEVIHWERF